MFSNPNNCPLSYSVAILVEEYAGQITRDSELQEKAVMMVHELAHAGPEAEFTLRGIEVVSIAAAYKWALENTHRLLDEEGRADVDAQIRNGRGTPTEDVILDLGGRMGGASVGSRADVESMLKSLGIPLPGMSMNEDGESFDL